MNVLLGFFFFALVQMINNNILFLTLLTNFLLTEINPQIILFQLQVDIIQKLESLAKALGEKATRDELLPFIELHYIELHDEILLYLADQLRTFIPLLGGLEHSKTIFDILGKLCITDENLVRERAVQTLISIQSELDTRQTEEYLLPVVNGLINDDWFTSKCSAVVLFAVCRKILFCCLIYAIDSIYFSHFIPNSAKARKRSLETLSKH